MEGYSQRGEKRRSSSEYCCEDDDNGSDESTSTSTGTNTVGRSSKGGLDQDKRLRREIANSNERRRMQSINAGFQSLKTLLPHRDGEKLSKAAILQQTTEYINAAESEKTRLLAQNEQLKRMIADLTRENEQQISPPPKRKKRDTEGSDEGIGGMSASESEEQSIDDLKGELISLRVQLDRERRLRMVLEERNRDLEGQLYPERIRQLANHVQAQIRYQDHKQKVRELNEEPCVRKAPEPEPQMLPQQQVARPPPPAPPTAIPVKAEPVLTAIPQPRAHIPSMNPAATSMSRRNLETIVEAIRHLEGDSMLFDSFKKPNDSSRDIPHSEGESEKESSMYSDEEIKSESSGRDSPPLFKPHHTTATATVHVRQEAIPVHSNVTQIATAPQFVSSERYPIATQLLHRPTALQQPFIQRPGVIVQNLS